MYVCFRDAYMELENSLPAPLHASCLICGGGGIENLPLLVLKCTLLTAAMRGTFLSPHRNLNARPYFLLPIVLGACFPTPCIHNSDFPWFQDKWLTIIFLSFLIPSSNEELCAYTPATPQCLDLAQAPKQQDWKQWDEIMSPKQTFLLIKVFCYSSRMLIAMNQGLNVLN